MRRLLGWTVIGLLALVLPVAATPAAPAPTDWDALLADYRSYGLPLPPPGAPLATVQTGWATTSDDGKEVRPRTLGFLLRAGKDRKPSTLLVGTETDHSAFSSEWSLVEPKAVVVADVWTDGGNAVFEVNVQLATALQCKSRGWDDLAETLLTDSLEAGGPQRLSQFRQPAGATPKVALASLALAHWANELLRPKTDRSVIAHRMRELFRAVPELRTMANAALLKSLEAALVPSKAPPSSIEGKIDALVDLPYPAASGGSDEPDPRLLRLERLGFRAVPALIEHLDDDRLTRTVKLGFNNFPTYHQRVGMIVGDLLQQLAGSDLGTDWLRRQQGYNVQKAAARLWWSEARKGGEEAYAVRHLLDPEPPLSPPNPALLRLLATRYPWRLASAYRLILRKRPELYSDTLAEAINRSVLNPNQKRLLFSEGAANSHLRHRQAALWRLKDLDRKQFLRVLIQSLAQLPRSPKGTYPFCVESGFSSLVLDADSAPAWNVLLRVAKRSDVGLRMELLNPLASLPVQPKQRAVRLRFLAGFLDDDALRDIGSNPKKWQGPYAGFGFPRLEVRNLAAMKAATLLELERAPQPDWQDAQWAEFRSTVRQALAQEFGRSLGGK